MKLLYLINTYPRPSHSFVRREVAALERIGHEVLRVAMRSPSEELVDPLDTSERAATEYVLSNGAVFRLASSVLFQIMTNPIKTSSALALSLRTWRAARKGLLRHLIYFAEACFVKRRCDRQNISHTHAHFGTNSATVAMLVNALGGPTFSFTVHGPEEFDQPNALFLSEKINRSAFAVGVSSYGRSQLCRWSRMEDWDKLKVVHCGIEPERYSEPVSMPSSGTRVVAIGRMAEQKGFQLLIQALANASDVHLTLVGDGEMRPEIEAAIGRFGVSDRVHLTGWLDEAGVRSAIQESHALVLPSFAEGLPMVVMEAMAASRPVIATYIAGVPELVENGHTGWLVPAGDADALANALRDFGATPMQRLQEMGAAARKTVLARHDVSTEAQKLSTHFAELGGASGHSAQNSQAPTGLTATPSEAVN